jgi:NADH-quinone oxidoreductase subunit L
MPALENKWYIDRVYDAVVIRPIKALASWFARIFDPKVVDGAVNGVGSVILDAGEVVRKLQNGAIPTYALSILLGVVAVLFYFLFVG